MQAEVISIGDEIVSGQLLDSNAQWLSTRMADLGIRVLYHTAVGDDLQAQADVFRQAIGRADVVVCTGGLGPTADDLTRQALADATGRALQRSEEALEHIRRLFERRKWEMPKRNELQAFFPDGSRMIHNPYGTAPGIDMQIQRDGRGACRFFALPGVPAEMREMWDGSVLDALHQIGAGRRVIVHKKISCFGAGEGTVEAMLPDLIKRGRVPAVGITASRTTIILRISAAGDSREECLAAMQPTIKTIYDCLGELVFGEDEDQLQDAVLRLLQRRGQSLSIAEWGTAGLVARWLSTAADEDKRHFLGGIVAQGAGISSALGLRKDLATKNRSDETAIAEVVGQMAIACRDRFVSDYGLAIGPFPDATRAAADDPPKVLVALATPAGPAGVITKSLPFSSHPATRETFCGKHALNLLRLTLR